MVSKTAIWSGRIAAFAAQLVILTALLHRFEIMSTPVALNLFASCFAFAVLAVVIGIAAYIVLWMNGGYGFARASFGILLGGLILAWPAIYLPKFVALPTINDVTTDTISPPNLANAAKLRASEANPALYPGGQFAKLQQISYPDIKPLVVTQSRAQVFDTARMIMKKREWAIVGEKRPGKGKTKRLGEIEAVDRTMVLGFSDDIVVRVGGTDGKTRVDVRSASRFGRHDFGRNAERIRGFLKELHARLDAGEELGVEGAVIARVPKSKKKRLRKRVVRRKYVRKRRASRRARKRKVWRRLRKQRRYRYKPFRIY